MEAKAQVMNAQELDERLASLAPLTRSVYDELQSRLDPEDPGFTEITAEDIAKALHLRLEQVGGCLSQLLLQGLVWNYKIDLDYGKPSPTPMTFFSTFENSLSLRTTTPESTPEAEPLTVEEFKTAVSFLRPIELRVYNEVLTRKGLSSVSLRPDRIAEYLGLEASRFDRIVSILVEKGLLLVMQEVTENMDTALLVCPKPIAVPAHDPSNLLPATRAQIRDYVEDAFDQFSSSVVYAPGTDKGTRRVLVRQIESMPMVRRSVVSTVTDIAIGLLAKQGLEATRKVILDRVGRVLRPEYRFLDA